MKNKKYRDFKRISDLLHVTEERLASMLGAGEEGDHVIHDKTRDMRYYLRTVGVSGDEYLVELYEVHGDDSERKVIFRNWLRSRRRRSAALPELLGVMILLGIAATGAALFYALATDTAGAGADYTMEVVEFRITRISDTAALAQISIRMYGTGVLDVGGGIAHLRLTDDAGAPANGNTRVEGLTSGMLVTYSGPVEMTGSTGPGEYIAAEITGGGGTLFHPVMIRE